MAAKKSEVETNIVFLKHNNKVVSFLKKSWNFIFKHKIIFISFLIIIILLLLLLFYIKNSFNIIVVEIENYKYSKADINMSLYNLKYNYFEKTSNEIPDATLDEQILSLNMTVSEYLKLQAINELKYQTAITILAQQNNILLTEVELDEIEEEKNKVIQSLGGHSKFIKFLYKNGINEIAYDKYLKINKLYDKVLYTLYSEGKVNYLTDEEIKNAKTSYYEEYYKINQIVLTIVNPTTMEKLSDTEIKEKESLIKKIKEETKGEVDFIELVENYSDEVNNDNNLYYKKGELLEKIESEVLELDTNEISDVIKTDYAFTIVKRLELDDKKLDEYLITKCQEKFNNDITKISDDYKVIYENAYKKIK